MYPPGYFGSFQNTMMTNQFSQSPYTPLPQSLHVPHPLSQFPMGYVNHSMYQQRQHHQQQHQYSQEYNHVPYWVQGSTAVNGGQVSTSLVEHSIKKTARKKAQQQICCEPFMNWCMKPNRTGRPPHSKIVQRSQSK